MVANMRPQPAGAPPTGTVLRAVAGADLALPVALVLRQNEQAADGRRTPCSRPSDPTCAEASWEARLSE
jgi:hypothetical protein